MSHEYYSERWARTTKANTSAMFRGGRILIELATLDITSPSILDSGCGTGWLTNILHEFANVVGVDLAPETAALRYPHIRFYRSEEAISQKFDVIISQEVVEHTQDQAGYLEQIASRLKPRGYLILTTPNASVSLLHPELLNQPIEQHLTRQQLRGLLNQRFDIVRMSSFFWGYAKLPWRSHKLNQVLEFCKLSDLVNETLWLGLHLIAVARLKG